MFINTIDFSTWKIKNISKHFLFVSIVVSPLKALKKQFTNTSQIWRKFFKK